MKFTKISQIEFVDVKRNFFLLAKFLKRIKHRVEILSRFMGSVINLEIFASVLIKAHFS